MTVEGVALLKHLGFCFSSCGCGVEVRSGVVFTKMVSEKSIISKR